MPNIILAHNQGGTTQFWEVVSGLL